MKRIIHVQVPAAMPTDQQQKVGEQIQSLVFNDQTDSIFVTPAGVTVHNVQVADEAQINGVYVYPLFGIDDIARIAMNTNADYCESLNEKYTYWEEADQQTRESVVRGVLFALRYNPTAKQQHEQWLKDKTAEGWTYGPEKNVETKQHPDLIPFDHLPAEQKSKSSIFLSLVSQLQRKLPAAAPDTQTVVKVNEILADGAQQTEQPFISLVKGDVFYFSNSSANHDGKIWVATSDVYVNYMTVPPVRSIDVEAYAPPAGEQEQPATEAASSTGNQATIQPVETINPEADA
jgi:hypothetical protein